MAKNRKTTRTRSAPGLLAFQTTTDSSEVALMMASFREGSRAIYTDKLIEKQVLLINKRRLTEKRYQRDPETGRLWPALAHSASQIKGSKDKKGSRKSNKLGAKIKLHDTGSMHDALYIMRAKLVDSTTGPRGVGVSSITLRDRPSKSSPSLSVKAVARKHQFGTEVVPIRRFMGVGKREGKEIEKIFDLRLARSTPGFGNPMT